MTRTVKPNGNIHLIPDVGKMIVDTRNNDIHSEVVCKPKNEHFFKEVDA